MRFYDAHNHLHDPRLLSCREAIIDALEELPIRNAVVNGTCEQDWIEVATLARRLPWVIPSFGYHPWFVEAATEQWMNNLCASLDEFPCAVGEIGIDRWMPNPNTPRQEAMFVAQLAIAAERDLPVSIHCLKAWGRLLELLSTHERPRRGFLLHSYGGPPEMIDAFVKLGGYFSCPGYFLEERKASKLEMFRRVPSDRLLLETDAPDQCLPPALDRFALVDPLNQRRLNHPGNIVEVYRGVAEALNCNAEELSAQIESNFQALFVHR